VHYPFILVQPQLQMEAHVMCAGKKPSECRGLWFQAAGGLPPDIPSLNLDAAAHTMRSRPYLEDQMIYYYKLVDNFN